MPYDTSHTDRWRMGFHLMPPDGWLNDPNGLCQLNGTYHVFHQYSPAWPQPDAPRGWGHFESDDLVTWRHLGMVISPDTPEDASGAYSGSAVAGPWGLRLYYTGNVKEPGDHDYVRSGRQANQILVESPDGRALGEKRVLLRNADYPASCSCHVRDPKVWRQGGSWWMLLGARDLDDRGLALVLRSEDGLAWENACELRPDEPFGYMWECPDRVELDGREWLSCCPQGMEKHPWSHGLRDQAGYFPLDEGARVADGGRVRAADFVLWDEGFDFYAPQTFVDERGRTLLVGWMGMPEPPFESAPEGLGWCHCLTVPRELATGPGGRILQRPTRELEALRGEPLALTADRPLTLAEHRADVVLHDIRGPFELALDGALHVACADGTLSLSFSDEAAAAGRDLRAVRCDRVRDLRVLVDSSAVEVYVNDGETVLSTRWFPHASELSVALVGDASEARVWPMGDGMAATYA